MSTRTLRTIEEEVADIAEAWRNSPYYDSAEDWLHVFWTQDGIFKTSFDRLDLSDVLELACGHGRHTEKIADSCGTLIAMDVLPDNIQFCQQRLSRFLNVNCVVNDGHSFQPVGDESISSVFCYDAMVHFSERLVVSYLHDAFRILRPGGRALFHHSNYDGPKDRHYGQNPHARNLMTRERFCEIAQKGGFGVVSAEVFAWGHEPDLDCLTLVEKPA